MDGSRLVRLLGFPPTLIFGNPAVLDRWLWLRSRLPVARSGERLLDVGCGSGAFTIGAALRGYEAIGLSWDEQSNRKATQRAALCGADHARFEIIDVRHLSQHAGVLGKFDVILNCENLEHIIDDLKLMRDMADLLKPGGYLLLTTPWLFYKPITKGDEGPFVLKETGAHVRRGYTRTMLEELCDLAGLQVEEVSSCYGFLSQKVTWLQRVLSQYSVILGWSAVLPLRLFPLALDNFFRHIFRFSDYSICIMAYKPRFNARERGAI